MTGCIAVRALNIICINLQLWLGENLGAILKEAGTDFANVVKSTIFLAPGQDFDAVNSVYKKYFPSEPPARETVWVHQLPKNALIEISMIAIL